MTKRLLTVEGFTLSADKEDIYSIVAASDGYDYILEEDENGTRFWKLYNNDDKDEKLSFNYETSNLPILSLVNEPSDKIIEKEEKQEVEENKPSPIKKIIVKKNIEPTSTENKLKIVKKVKTEETKEPTKKLSKYHTFIKEFLAENSHIPWNERMKAANEAWKIAKEA